jgi:hypothetical protein
MRTSGGCCKTSSHCDTQDDDPGVLHECTTFSLSPAATAAAAASMKRPKDERMRADPVPDFSHVTHEIRVKGCGNTHTLQ